MMISHQDKSILEACNPIIGQTFIWRLGILIMVVKNPERVTLVCEHLMNLHCGTTQLMLSIYANCVMFAEDIE